ncbi:M23 family metallopeptidase [Phototrophicus methaneseepsis]|uniref:M23 family metallopeptidase n=1 Tax=Phototrophicus methaneseepsis TaxID=2710758 RepID=A0A7S8E5P4_9CHLR|nr:M23 family metallopeptidase [Phototrophicus methaneseepsis]QPC80846.1 M23 family metallopeptidase [Phototrophicus methaneseepsis]
MMRFYKLLHKLLIVLLVGLAGCTAAVPATLTPTPLPIMPTMAISPIATAALAASATPLVRASSTPLQLQVVTPTLLPTETLPATATIQMTASVATSESATATATPAEEVIGTYWLRRPIDKMDDDGRVDYVDRTYPYGGTQFGRREVHLGVEFVNQRFTPVVAAADGEVIFAGMDSTQQVGPQLNYYGNVVVVAHDFLGVEQQVFTVYAHLQDIAVEEGQHVARGDRIGRVGDTGIAIGPHLHFEVREGEDGLDYRNTRNPILWIAPYTGFGTLAGYLRAETTEASQGQTILVRSPDRSWETYTYGSDRVNPSDELGENFALSDLPAGEYEVIVSNENGSLLFRQKIIIDAGRTTWLDIDLRDASS